MPLTPQSEADSFLLTCKIDSEATCVVLVIYDLDPWKLSITSKTPLNTLVWHMEEFHHRHYFSSIPYRVSYFIEYV